MLHVECSNGFTYAASQTCCGLPHFEAASSARYEHMSRCISLHSKHAHAGKPPAPQNPWVRPDMATTGPVVSTAASAKRMQVGSAHTSAHSSSGLSWAMRSSEPAPSHGVSQVRSATHVPSRSPLPNTEGCMVGHTHASMSLDNTPHFLLLSIIGLCIPALATAAGACSSCAARHSQLCACCWPATAIRACSSAPARVEVLHINDPARPGAPALQPVCSRICWPAHVPCCCLLGLLLAV